MKKLYEQDHNQWVETMADLLASGNFTRLDIENLVEEVRDLPKYYGMELQPHTIQLTLFTS